LLPFSSDPVVCHLLSKSLRIRIYKTTNLDVLLYGRETCSPILREEHRLRVIKDRGLKRILGLKRDDVTAGCRKLHNNSDD
jgi:hypothetical protein